MTSAKLALALTSVLAAACGPVSDDNGFVGGDGDGGAATGSDAGVDAQTECDEQGFAIDRQPTKLMLVLDMSGSMSSKYVSARNGITNAITNLSGLFELGFNSYPVYPYSGQCSIAPTALIDTAPGNETAILNWLSNHQPQGGAGDPLVVQMDAILGNAGYATNFTSTALTSENYLVVVSDGDDCCGPAPSYNCGNEWTAELVDRTEQLLQMGIKTIVVGYAGADDATMNAIALAGGSPFTTYLPASDETALQSALETIGAAVVSCSFAVDVPTTSNPDEVNLYFDGALVPYEPGCATGTGWDWSDPAQTTIQLCANSCDQLRTDTVENVTAKFGCASVQID